MFIDGRFIESSEDLHVYSPYNGNWIGKVSRSSVADVEAAANSSFYAFSNNKHTLRMFCRYQILFNVYEELRKREKELSELITSECGKVIREAKIEVQRACNAVLFAAEESKRIYGQVLPCDITQMETQKMAYVQRKPVGVIAAVTPFNFPLNTVVHKIAPAIAAGNAVVLKPSPQTPLSAERLAEIFNHAGLPGGMFNIVQGGSDIGEALVSNPLIRMISFTGSVKTGHRVVAMAGMKKLILELGGNDALVVFEDADIDDVVKTAVEQGLGTCGQRCTAVKRIYLQAGVYDRFMKRLIPAVEKLIAGDPLDPSTQIGPMISEKAAVDIEAVVADAVASGAKAIVAGSRDKAVLSPTILTEVPDHCRVICEETFGPVLPVMRFNSIDEVIKRVNSSAYGLQAGVFTRDLAVVKKMHAELDVGTLIVNDGPGFRVESLPFGGVKQSGLGREGIIASVRAMTEESVLIM